MTRGRAIVEPPINPQNSPSYLQPFCGGKIPILSADSHPHQTGFGNDTQELNLRMNFHYAGWSLASTNRPLLMEWACSHFCSVG